MAELPGGVCRTGDAFDEGCPTARESPVREGTVTPFANCA